MQPGPPPRPPPPITFEDYVGLAGAAKVWGPTGAAGYYRIDMATYSAIEAHWAQFLPTQPHFANHAALIEQEAQRLRAGGALRPIQAFQTQSLDRGAEQVGNAIGQGISALGSAFDSIGKSVTGPSVGSRVMVQWSDGNRYPGTIAQMAQGQYFVTMQNGQQLWVPAAYVTVV